MAIDLLEELAGCSLVEAKEAAGKMRFGMLETMRAFAVAHRIVDTVEDLRSAHLEYFLAFAEQASKLIRGPMQPEWLARFAFEQENIHKALEFALTSDPSKGLRLAIAAYSFWEVSANNSESRGWLGRFLSLEHPYDPHLRTLGLCAAGAMALYAGQFPEAKRYLMDGLVRARELGDERLIAQVSETLGFTLVNLGEFEVATHLIEEGIELAEKLGDQPMLCRMFFEAAAVCHYEADAIRAFEYLDAGLSIARQLNDPVLIERTLCGYASHQLMIDRPIEAEAMFEEVLHLATMVGDIFAIGLAKWGLSLAAWSLGNLERALELCREHGEVLRRSGMRWGMPHFLEGFSRIELSSGRKARAVALFAASQSYRSEISAPYPKGSNLIYKDLKAAIKEVREEQGMEAAWHYGEHLSWDAAAELAMSGDDPPTSRSRRKSAPPISALIPLAIMMADIIPDFVGSAFAAF